MRVLMLTWEYPPASVGGLGNHVCQLSKAMDDSVFLDVITVAGEDLPLEEDFKNVTVYRVPEFPVNTPDFSTWVMQVNMALLEKAIELGRTHNYDLVHAHDWLVAYASRVLKSTLDLPLVATIHATEAGRNQGLHNSLQNFINSVEWWLTYEAWRVIVCSSHMRQEVKSQFQLPEDKIHVIPNGINPSEFQFKQKANKPDNKNPLIFFVGRLVREKGAQVLLEAFPRILRHYPNARLVIAGKGPMRDQLISMAGQLGVKGNVDFPGFVDDETRNKFYHGAKVAVFPSLYEPFGIVALEGMAAGTAVVASDTGGLGEIITHGVNGLKAYPGNPNSLADNIIALLRDENLAATITTNAKRLIEEKYGWESIAKNTLNVYQEVLRSKNEIGFTPVEPERAPLQQCLGSYELRSSLMAQRVKSRKGKSILCKE